MHGCHRHGRDYTPLFRFLLSRVGASWDEVYAEAKPRLDTHEPIYWIVATSEATKRDWIRTDESTYFSGLYVDDQGILCIVNPALKPEDMTPYCTCCTHTLNGVRFGSKS